MKTKTNINRKIFLTIGLIVLVFQGFAQTTQTFTSTGTWTCPAGVTTIQVEAWGAGGGGGGNTSTSDGSGGGGGGAYSKSTTISVTPGTTYTVTVGTGGIGSTLNGTSGGDSWFNTTATLMAKGGNGGIAGTLVSGAAGGTGGAAASGVGTTKFSGGDGGYGRSSSTGKGGPGGSSAGTAANGTSGTNPWSTVTAAAAPTGGGIGGDGGTTGQNGVSGAIYGAGGGGSGDRSVSNVSGGNGANGKVILTWNCVASHTLTAATTTTGPICVGGTSVVTLSSTSMVSGTYTVTYNLAGANSATGNTASMTFTAGSPGTGTFTTAALTNAGATTITITNLVLGTGCGSAISSNNTASITVNNTLTASIAISASATSICTGTNVTFTATPTNGGSTPVYQWKLNGANVGTNSNIYSSSTLANNDNVTCILTSNATPCLAGSPATSNTVTMTVNPALIASVSITASANNICTGTNVTFTATPTNGGSTPVYQWKVNGTNVGTNSTTYSTTTLANNDNVTCVLTSNATPCLTGSPATSNVVTMTVTSGTLASVTISASATTICAGTSVTFTATPTNGGASPSYQWKLNGVNVGTNSTTYTNSVLVNNDSVTCVLTSATSCMPATSNAIVMSVTSPIVASVSIVASATSICSGTNVTFTATPTNGGSSPVYQWKLNGANVGTNSNIYSSSTLANNDNITCILTSNATPCLSGSPATSNTVIMTVNPTLVAGVIITTSSTTICFGASTTFTATPTNGGTTPVYQWELNGSNVGTNSTTYTSTSLTDGDQIICIMTSNATPCLVGSPATSNTITLTVNTTPSITSSTPGARTGTGTVNLAATAGGETINWYSALSGGSSIGTGTSFTTPSISATTTFYAEAVTSGGCASTPRTPIIASVYTPEIDIQGNLISIPDGDTIASTSDWTDFSASSSRTFTILNTGTGILNIGAITFTGTNASEFTIEVPPSSSVAAGGSTTFTVQFTPSASGLRIATINIANDDADENLYDFKIQGTGVTQAMNIQGNGTNVVDGATTASLANWTDFSNVAITRTFTIQNTGSINLTIGAITFGGTNPSDFSIVTPPSSIVEGRSTTTFVVKFTAGAASVRSATISIVNNDPASGKNPYNFLLTGNTTSINMNVKAGSVLIADGSTIPSSTDWTDFGSSNVSSPITRTFTIENTGTSTLSLTGSPRVVLTSGSSSDFSVTTQPAATVGNSSTTTFIVTFNPSSTGSKTAGISIANNDVGAGKNPYTFNIKGNGIQSFADSDSDGIYNHLDTDDDNDGIPDNIEQSYASGSVLGTQVQVTLLNETFGAGTTRGRINDNVSSATTTYCWEDGTTARAADECDTNPDLQDGKYTISNSAQNSSITLASWAATYWYTGGDHTPADTNGKMGLFNATNNITEEFYRTTVQGVITNAPLTYSFWVLNLDRSNAPSIDTRNRPNITVEFRDLSNNLISTINTGDIAPTSAANPNGSWYQFSASFIPTTTGFSIVFRNNQPGGGGNDLALDDILIVQQLTDSDQDGIADAYDLDSDNDGIGDINEDLWTSLSNGKDTMDLSGGTWIDANNNGWHDTAEAYYATGSPKNFDGDAVPNYIDLDSDNDSIFDTNEAGLTNGDGDVNDDGEGEGTDIDGDGILSSFDSLNGFANNGKVLPTNTLGSGNADYLKVISKTAGVYDITNTLYASLDTNNDGKIDGSTDVDRDGILDTFDTSTSIYGSPRNLDRKLLLDFDGRNDYGQGTGVLGGLANASLMAWVDLNSAFASDGVVVGQNNFHIRITSGKNLEAVVNGTTLNYNTTSLNSSQWTHVGAVYGGGFLKLYLNGVMVKSTALSGSINADATLLTIGKDPSTNTKFFKGKIDEVRVFNVALTDAQFQRMVYQEIQNSSTKVRGLIIPKDVGSLPFANVLRYYRMDTYKDDIIDDLTTTSIDAGTGMKIYNHKNIYVQQAPMPFITERTGSFATAVNSPTKDIRGLDIMDQDWSIVQVKHNITETSNNTDAGMIVDSGVTIVMNNDNKIQNDWYLKLNGKIDLQGKSQLVQTINSDLDVTSAGYIERDQQGQSNKFNYNYWSSPVCGINTISNNNSYTVDSIMKDGTDPANIKNITWVTGYDGSATSPISLSNYWIFKFQNVSPVYANWAKVGQTGSLLAGQGFTMKGSGTATATQNYTFVGKPNNGSITSPIAANSSNLSGNPYPSALDAYAFIDDNIASTTGTLYFWEHYSTNSSHVLAAYQGGYATLNKTGTTPPAAPAGISTAGSSSRRPGRYIPVGQGFFLSGNATGGTISFNNNQRAFIKEDDAVNSNVLFRQSATVSPVVVNQINKQDAIPEEVNFTKIRLGFLSSDNYRRELLLGFMNENATSEIDPGYDAIQFDTQSSDIYFLNNSTKLVIQGDSYFDSSRVFPIGVKTAKDGKVKLILDKAEYFDQNSNIYIYDNVTNIYHDIRNEEFEVNLPAGTVNDRFSLRFTNPSTLAVNNFDSKENIKVVFTNSDNTINVKNNLIDTTVKSVILYNILGQSLNTWNVKNEDQTKIQIPVTNLSTGTYIVKLQTTKGDISKKIIIK